MRIGTDAEVGGGSERMKNLIVILSPSHSSITAGRYSPLAFLVALSAFCGLGAFGCHEQTHTIHIDKGCD